MAKSQPLSREVTKQLCFALAEASSSSPGSGSKSTTSRRQSEILSALHGVHGALVLSALDIVDRAWVSCIRSPAGREVFYVQGSAGRGYSVLAEEDYCSCLFFHHRVLLRGDAAACKHLLAARLAVALDRVEGTRRLGESEFSQLLLEDEHQ